MSDRDLKNPDGDCWILFCVKESVCVSQHEQCAHWLLWPERQFQSPNRKSARRLRWVMCVSLSHDIETHPIIFVAHPEHKSPQNSRKIQPRQHIIHIFIITHDALVCRVASTTEKTRLQTTRDQHMHPSVMYLCAC